MILNIWIYLIHGNKRQLFHAALHDCAYSALHALELWKVHMNFIPLALEGKARLLRIRLSMGSPEPSSLSTLHPKEWEQKNVLTIVVFNLDNPPE